jgi:RimJ/RimL family protein N-acetyltransferase
MMPPMTHPLWPLFDLRVGIGRLELRLPTDEDLAELAALAKAGIHPPHEMPFGVAWTRRPSPELERGFARYHWSRRAGWQPDDWGLELMVALDGTPIGVQALFGRRFAVHRRVSTGSWLGRAWQGQGHGKAMRTAVLALAFDHLGAEVAESKAFLDNERSAGVSRSLGYVENGIGRIAPEEVSRETQRFRMTLGGWRSRPRPPVAVEGLEPCLELFGVRPA